MRVFSTFGQGLSDSETLITSPITSPQEATHQMAPTINQKKFTGRFGTDEMEAHDIEDYSPPQDTYQQQTFHVRKHSKVMRVRPLARYKNLKNIYQQKLVHTTMGARSHNTFSSTFQNTSYQKTVSTMKQTSTVDRKTPKDYIASIQTTNI